MSRQKRLEHIGPYNRTHSSTERVEPYQGYRDNNVKLKGDAKRLEHQQLQHGTHYKKSHSRAGHLGEEEKPSPGVIGAPAVTLVKVAVD